MNTARTQQKVVKMRSSCAVSTFLILLFLVLVTASDANERNKVYVCSRNSSFGLPFKDLASVINEKIHQKINISFCSGPTILTGDFSIFDQLEIDLIGDRSTSTLECSGESAGISLTNVKSVFIQNIKMVNCSSVHIFKNTKWTPTNFSAALFILNSSSVMIQNSSISYSCGLGLVILETYSFIEIANSIFESSHRHMQYYGGGGLYIELKCNEKSEQCMNTSLNLIIINTTFRNNSASSSTTTNTDSVLRFGTGGGLSLLFKGSVSNNTVRIINCIFEFNSASNWGGGLNIAISNSSESNTIIIEDSTFFKNTCNKKGGGGADVGFLFRELEASPNYNKICFVNTIFNGNSAVFGGGSLVYSTQADSATNNIENNEVVFVNCTWKKNRARYAAALYLTFHNMETFNRVGNLPTITLINGVFIANQVRSISFRDKGNYYRTQKRGRGTFISIGYKIALNSSMQFTNNSGTALYLVSSTVKVNSNNTLTFTGNTGYYGGAISMFGISTLHLHDNVHFNFTNNLAVVQGGAIYQESIDNLEYISIKNCFIYYSSPYLRKRQINDTNIIFTFKNNTVQEDKNFGHTMFIHSVKSCTTIVNFSVPVYNDSGYLQYLGQVARFDFENVTTLKKQMSSGYASFKAKKNITGIISFIPGKLTELPLEVSDDFGNIVPKLHQATLENSNDNISIDPAYTQTFLKKILLCGKPGTTANISFSLSIIKREEIILSVQLQECPPGYVYESGLGQCTCSAYTHNQYLGISSCNQTAFQAKLSRGYWLGYSIKKVLLSSACPVNFCNSNQELLLPSSKTSAKELNGLVCGRTRMGKLCGACKENYSTFYHSVNLNCRPNHLCDLGWAFYLVSEILPVTIFFLIVVLLDIQFTAGSVQGFILYSQLFDTLLIVANGQNPLKEGAYNSLLVLDFFTNIFNLKFFIHNRLSFCLWRNASSLDILTFKYITITYSFLLIILTVLVLRYSKFSTLQKFLGKIRRNKSRGSYSLIHGLSGFLVICYSQCTKISLLILTPATIYSTKSDSIEKVAFFDGQLPFLRSRHLLYALPAIIFTLTMVVLPPVLLLSYPLCYKLFALFKIQETKFTNILCTVFPLEKYKPFFDSFQSSFKDECRYFAGLYFVYRLSTLVTFASTQNLPLFYTLVEVQFIIMLTVHVWIQPYKMSWHNKLDGFVFASLAIINIITLFRYSHSSNHFEAIQIVVAYLPLLYMATYVVRQMVVMIVRPHISRNRAVAENDLTLSISKLTSRYEDDDTESDKELSSTYKRETC